MASGNTTDASVKAGLDFAGALKDTLVAGIVAFGLFCLILGLRTEQGPTGALVLLPRPQLLFMSVGLVMAGRFLIALFFRSGALRRSAAFIPAPFARLNYLGNVAGGALLIFALIIPVMFFDNRYILDVAILVMTYVMLGWGLNIVVGLAGLLDLGYAAFYAVGAYSFALLATNFGLSFWICLPLAGILAAFWGILLGFPVLRLRGDYLAIVTLAFGEIIRLVILNWQEFTGGPNGLSGIPRPSFFGLPFTAGDEGFAAYFGLEFNPSHRVVFLFYVILGLALLTNFVTLRLRRLPIGRAWEAMREDEIACRSLGINTTNTKLTAFALGAMFGGIAGAFFATRQGFISPESFTFMESAMIVAIVVLGGMGSQLGVALSALIMVGGFEVFREFEQYRMLIFGLAMVAIMVWRPRGLISQRDPSIHLHAAKPISAKIVEEARS
ncbi:MAG TPA: high-affinity branched-chain amino acid ABC transporter permease LivM [Xanthobacteraceae bacterium]|nr:high-affinity branched-chain amino acid ABC transporter permease LivM [Xanthobacteraceae bacterium]